MKPSEQAALFDRLASGTCLYAYAPEAIAAVDALVPAKGRLLDVGCGDGAIGQGLHADDVVGFDISFRCACLATGRGVPSLVADASGGFPFPANAFDTVYCVDVLHHLGRAWDAVLDEADRVLRPGGAIAIVEPDARNPFVRWTQAPGSPIRVAPYRDEPAIDPEVLLPYLKRRGYEAAYRPIQVDGEQVERGVFPLWQRLLKAPFVLALAHLYRKRPNKFAMIARKRGE